MADIKTYMQQVGQRARAAARAVARADTASKNAALLAMAAMIDGRSEQLVAANQAELAAARGVGLDAAMLDRLTLSAKGVAAMAEGLRQIAALPDPVGTITDMNYRPSGIQVGKIRVPLGVIGIIYEARPNVTADAAGLCLKSGNAAILRGGSEALRSNQAIAACVRGGLEKAGLPLDAVQVIDTTDRAAVGELITKKEYVDVIVPRGGKGLLARVGADLDAARAHIERYGSQHTDAIVTEDYTRARRFLREVDSSSVMVNASTRFADGFEYGLGAEIGISTDKIHVRGPVGLEGLTSQKFIVLGEGHVRK